MRAHLSSTCPALSLLSHCLSVPKPIIVLNRPRVRMEAQINGGGQERGLRSGTLPTPLVVGFGTACEVASQEMVRASPPLLLTACSSSFLLLLGRGGMYHATTGVFPYNP